MKKTLGRVAGAVLAGAVISLAVTPVAMAQTETTTSSPSAPPETTSSAPAGPTYTGGPVTSAPPETSAPGSSSQQPTSTPTPTSGKPTSGSPSPTSTSEKPTPTTPPKPVLNVGAGYVEGTDGALAIFCGSEPTDVNAPDYDIVEVFQDGGEAYLWVYMIKAKPGFKGTSSTFTWTCDGKPGKGDIEIEGTVGGGSNAPGVKPEKQVKLKPKGGIETGSGATAA
ncbi:hypothetical protein [Amycolatopsis regifaucium]|uniref:Uncharacterized protein n=1 Tax=Amycolatopsis regifaucium TaxID=546365 RepID=A0A154MQU4_9PSEU|nr:hypothetical protein [Amycolatopsis regifaucium]KZB86470.1 hypothetical protein AVL48_26770 [Amycolatopsis regifaucium]OKA06411.1 hypothetical protein ATP06_0225180 [Amycolatopsis regifaucium]